MAERAKSTDNILKQAWQGDIGLFRAAFGLGGLGLTLISVAGGIFADAIGSLNHIAEVIASLAFNGVQLALSWIAVVATWRAASHQRPNKKQYGPISIALALLFVGLQMVLTIFLTGWSSLSALGYGTDLSHIISGAVLGITGTDVRDINNLLQELTSSADNGSLTK